MNKINNNTDSDFDGTRLTKFSTFLVIILKRYDRLLYFKKLAEAQLDLFFIRLYDKHRMGYHALKGDEKYSSGLTKKFGIILNSIDFELPKLIRFQMLELNIIFMDLIPLVLAELNTKFISEASTDEDSEPWPYAKDLMTYRLLYIQCESLYHQLYTMLELDLPALKPKLTLCQTMLMDSNAVNAGVSSYPDLVARRVSDRASLKSLTEPVLSILNDSSFKPKKLFIDELLSKEDAAFLERIGKAILEQEGYRRLKEIYLKEQDKISQDVQIKSLELQLESLFLD